MPCRNIETDTHEDHTVMVIWAYSMLTRDAARKAGNALSDIGAAATDVLPSAGFKEESVVLLGCGSSTKTNAFISTGVGRPYLQLATSLAANAALEGDKPSLVDLRLPQQILAAGVYVMEAGFPNDTRERLPPLIKSLCDLMDLLASLR